MLFESKKRVGLSLVSLVVGFLLTSVVGLLLVFNPQDRTTTDALYIGLLGTIITLVFELRVVADETRKQLEELQIDRQSLARIRELAERDESFGRRYQQLRQEIKELAEGTYRVQSLTDLYADDIESVEVLVRGERLLSTCPVDQRSVDHARRQLENSHYQASMAAHLRAVERGVHATRIYLVGSDDYVEDAWIAEHLWSLQEQGLDVQIMVRDKAEFVGDFDFNVFGERKVSVGVAEPGSGVLNGAVVYSDPVRIEMFARKFSQFLLACTPAHRPPPQLALPPSDVEATPSSNGRRRSRLRLR